MEREADALYETYHDPYLSDVTHAMKRTVEMLHRAINDLERGTCINDGKVLYYRD